MLNDKWLRWFYVFLIFVFIGIYYTGEARNRRLEELGFSVCEINNVKTWSTRCPKEENIFNKWSK